MKNNMRALFTNFILLISLKIVIADDLGDRQQNPAEKSNAETMALLADLLRQKSVVIQKALDGAIKSKDFAALQVVSIAWPDNESAGALLRVLEVVDLSGFEEGMYTQLSDTVSEIMLKGVIPDSSMINKMHAIERRFENHPAKGKIIENFDSVGLLYGYIMPDKWSRLKGQLGWPPNETEQAARVEFSALIYEYRSSKNQVPGLLLHSIKQRLAANKASRVPDETKRPKVLLPR